MNALQLEEKEPIVYYDENEIVSPEESDLDVKDLRHEKKL